MMTSKHYVAVARIVRDTVDEYGPAGPLAEAVADAIARGVADVFAADNPRFDRDAFLAACGVVE